MGLSEFLKEHSLYFVNECSEDDNGAEALETKEVYTSEEGLTLLEYESNVVDSLISEETIKELFPGFDAYDSNKGYLIEYGDKLIAE